MLDPPLPKQSSPLDALRPSLAFRWRTATEFVEATLKAAILDGRLPGGTPLRQEELAARFGLSRMPVREALRQLESQALIDVLPHRGAVVTEISAADAADTYAIRRALEPAALRLSIPRLSDHALRDAAALIDEMDAEQEAGRMGLLNRRFHMTLYAAAGHPRLLALTEQQLIAFDRYLRFHLASQGRAHMGQEEHRAMLEAVRARDIGTAIVVLERHLDTAAGSIARFFATRGGVTEAS